MVGRARASVRLGLSLSCVRVGLRVARLMLSIASIRLGLGSSRLGLASVRLGLGLASVRLGLKFTGGLYDASDYKSTEANTKM